MRLPSMHEDCDEKCLNLAHHGHECHSNCEALAPSTSVDLLNMQRIAIQNEVILAVMNLFGHTLTDSFLLPVERTNPQLFVATGTADSIRELLKDK